MILLYHRVGGGTTLDVDLDPGLFEEQMATLEESASVVSLGDALERLKTNGVTPPQPSIVVTFDDGTADFADVAMPIMERHRIPATLYVATEFIEARKPFPENGVPLSWSALADVQATGLVNIGSHTHQHRLLDRVSEIEAAEELDRSIDMIERSSARATGRLRLPEGRRRVRRELSAPVRKRFRSAALAGTRRQSVRSDRSAAPRTFADPGERRHALVRSRRPRAGWRSKICCARSLNRVRYSRSTT